LTNAENSKGHIEVTLTVLLFLTTINLGILTKCTQTKLLKKGK